jgi:hypothetical protein
MGANNSLVWQFVTLAKRHTPREWWDLEDYPANLIKEVFAELIKRAGFNPDEVVLGKLHGNYRDQDGNTGETYPINGVSPFKVVTGGRDNYAATGWLDCAMKMVVVPSARKDKTDKQLVAELEQEIERARPLEPIQLTSMGDMLRENMPRSAMFGRFEYFVDHLRDKDSAMSAGPIGLHMYCGGYLDRHRATAEHDSISCRQCHLRALVPKEAKTYGELRRSLPISGA